MTDEQKNVSNEIFGVTDEVVAKALDFKLMKHKLAITSADGGFSHTNYVVLDKDNVISVLNFQTEKKAGLLNEDLIMILIDRLENLNAHPGSEYFTPEASKMLDYLYAVLHLHNIKLLRYMLHADDPNRKS